VSGIGVLGLLWAVAGILVGFRWWRGRTAAGPAATEARAATARRARFGQVAEDRSPQRWQAMRLAYALGAWLVALGLAADLVPALAAGAVALNLGTVFRYLVVAMDREALDLPLLDLERSARILFGDVADRATL
jgi:hypothetical protein